MRMVPQVSARVVFAGGLVAIVLGAGVVAQQRAAAAMPRVAAAFLASLTPEQRAKASFDVKSDELTRWNFVPAAQFPRSGLALREMTDPQRTLAHDLLKLGLSQRGYLQANTIMDLENLLHEIEGGKGPAGPNGWPYRDPGQYFVSIFGEPSPTGTWGWRVEGHHLSIRFVVKGSAMQVSSTPTFFGSNPAEVRQGPKTGARALGHQEDVARTLLDALSTEQKATALIAPMPPGEIATRTTVKVDPLTPAGLMASEMTPAQRDLLVKIIEAYTGAMTDDVAVDRMQKVIAAGIEKVGFAWAGSFERGQRHHYRVQGPTFLIEHNNTQNNGNHVHSVWRDFAGDFGRDLIAEHLAAVPHRD